MARVFQITDKELRFLLMFEDIQGLCGFGEKSVIETEEIAKECLRTLCEKGYIYSEQHKKYAINSTLELILITAANPYGYFIMENLRQDVILSKTVIYFLNDVIGIVEQRDENYELIWVPYLPLAIGKVANLHTPFLNRDAVEIGEYTLEDGEKYIDCYLKKGFKYQWEMWGKELAKDKKISIVVLSDEKEQVLIKESKGKVHIVKPDKEIYVNTITKCIAPIHGNAIRMVYQEE